MSDECKNQSVGSDGIKGSLVDLYPGTSHALLCTLVLRVSGQSEHS